MRTLHLNPFKFKNANESNVSPQESLEIAGENLESRKINLLVNLIGVTNGDIGNLTFMKPIVITKLCFITAKAPIIPKNLELIRCFAPTTWITIFISQILLYSWFSYTRNLYYHRQWNITISRLIMATFEAISNNNAINPSHFRYFSQRVIIFCILFFSLTIGGIYEGHLITSYSTVIYFKDIATLQDLDKSGCKILLPSTFPSLFVYDKPDENSTMYSLLSKTDVTDETFEWVIRQIGSSNNICSVSGLQVLKIVQETTISEEGIPKLNIVKECTKSAYASYLTRKGWAFEDRINYVLGQFVASGINTFFDYF